MIQTQVIESENGAKLPQVPEPAPKTPSDDNEIKKRRKKRWIRVLAILLLMLLLPVLVMLGIGRHIVRQASPFIVDTPEKLPDLDFDAALVLGARVYPGGTMSPRLRDRVEQGICVLEAGKTKPILLSGDGRGEYYDEVEAMQRYCLLRGVDKEMIWGDPLGLSTYQSMLRARDVYGLGRIVIVTQRYHLYRAVYLARSLGIDAYGVSADLRPYSDQSWQDTREMLARVKAFFNAQGLGL